MPVHRSLRDWTSVVLVAALGCSSDVVGCAGCGLKPLPGGALPAGQTIEGGAQLRITEAGFDQVEQVVKAVVTDALGDGLCVPQQNVTVLGTGFRACHENQCADGSQGCRVSLALTDFQMAAPDHSRLRVGVRANMSAIVPVQAKIFGRPIGGACQMRVVLRNGGADAAIGLVVDPSTGELDIRLRALDLVLNGFDAANCGLVDNAVDLAVAILRSPIGSFLVNVLTPTFDRLIRSFLPQPLGLEGMLDLGALLGGISPGATGSVEARVVPGGYVGLPARGLSIGLITGFNADEDPTTRTADLASEPAFCVPPFAAPDLASPPHRLRRTARQTFALPPAGAFFGAPDADTDLVVGLSETLLDLIGHHAVSSGALCLSLGTELVPELNLGAVGLIIPSLAELGSERGDDPLLLALRPTQPLDFTIGAGSESDPHLTMHVRGLDIDFYAYLFERFVRGFTLRVDLDVGLNLGYTVDAAGRGALEPLLVNFDPSAVELNVHNAEFVRESAAEIEGALPAVLTLALPLLTSGIGPITLPEIAGFTLSDIALRKVSTAADDFLAVNASLLVTDNLVARLGGQPHSALAALARPLPPRRPVDTRAYRVDVATPAPERLQAWARGDAAGLPQVTVELEATADDGRALEWSWRLNGGLWHPFRRDDRLVVSDPQLAVQARHNLEIKARAVGDPLSVDPTPAAFEVLVDSAGPRIHRRSARFDGDALLVTANDLVLADQPVQFAFAAGAAAAEPDTDWRSEGRLAADEVRTLAVDGAITVFARDALANVSRATIYPNVSAPPHQAPAAGCACAAGAPATGSQGGPLVLTLIGLALLSRYRRRSSRRPCRRRLGTAGAIFAIAAAAAAGAACASSTMPAAECDREGSCAPTCARADECPCDPGTVEVCTDQSCMCTHDLRIGRIGEHSALAVAPDGAAWVSAYNSDYGDLVAARWAGAGRIDAAAWQFVDGVPDGPVDVPGSATRQGITSPGPDVGLYTSIAVAPAGEVMISYYDRHSAALKFAHNAGGSWAVHVVDPGKPGRDAAIGYAIVGRYSSLLLRADDGRPSVAYFAEVAEGSDAVRAELRFAQATVAKPSAAADWTVTVVDSGPIAAHPIGAAAVPAGVGLFAAAAYDPAGEPVIAYYDRSRGDLKLARRNGTDGQFAVEVLDRGGASGSGEADVGWHPSLAVDTSGVAHVSYVDATADDLRYIDSERRRPETVDDGYRIDGLTREGLPLPVFHLVGDDSALVLTAGGPMIGYQDATTHELRLAVRNGDGAWESSVVAGNEDPFAGAYGFYANAARHATELVMSSWVIDQPNDDAWVEIFRRTIAEE
jgi:hypothetical protein